MKRGQYKRRSHKERFNLHVEKLEGEDACWLWRGSIKKTDGYGLFRVGDEIMPTHKFAWMAEHGALPEPHEVVDQRCGKRACVRPSHLFLRRRKGLVWATKGQGNFKFNNDQVRDMRDSAEAGEGISSIARRYEAALDHVRGIVKWERRKNVHHTKCESRVKGKCTCRVNNQTQGEQHENGEAGKLVSDS